MATKCCSGGNECNHVATIGYLKNLVNVSGEGNIVSVNNSDNTYCPTYDELTGGTLIANHSDGSTPNGDIDGIIVSGSYSGNQAVNQEDISLVYTRFKSLTISASKTTNLDPCGDSSTLSYVHTYTRYTRAMTSDCQTVDDPFEAVTITSSDVNDTANNEVSWSIAATAYGSISYPTYTIGKNGDGRTTTTPRYDDITASITFRGTTHNSNTIRIRQNGLGGNYVRWYSDYDEYYSYDDYVISPSSFDCNGGTWTGIGYYTRHDWYVYRWQDGCGVYHNDVTTTDDDTYTQKTETYNSGTVSSVDCSTISSTYYDSGSDTYHGHTAYWSQSCSPCSNCDSVTLSPNSMSWQYDSTSESSATYSYTAAGISNFRTACTDTTNFTVTHNSSTKTITVKPNSQNSTLTARTATVTLTYDTATQNNCSKTIGLTQGTQACDCGGLTIDTSTMSWAYNDSTQQTRTYAASNCITNVSAGTSNNWFSVDYATAGQIKVQPSGSNTTMTAKTGTITVTYDANDGGTVTHCSSSFTVSQGVESCTCSSVTVSPTSYSWSWNDTDTKYVTVTSANCITNITTGGSMSDFSASIGADYVAVWPDGTNTSSSDYTGRLDITYSFDNPTSSCTKSVTLTQYSQGCTCGALTMSNSPMSWGSTETTASARTYTLVDASCVGTVTVSTGGTNGNKFTASLSGNRLTVAPIGTNTTSSAYNGTVTLTYAVNGIGNCYITFDVTQAGTTCNCNSFSMITGDLTLECTATTGTRAFTPGTCNTVTSVTSSNNWFTAAVNGNNIVITASGVNDSGLAKSATITVNYTANGSTCTAKTFTVIQAGCNPCDNISGLPDSINFTAS